MLIVSLGKTILLLSSGSQLCRAMRSQLRADRDSVSATHMWRFKEIVLAIEILGTE
jgi:hypothetical protein